jgi:hypothetical protein
MAMAKLDAKVTSYTAEVVRTSGDPQVRTLQLTLEGNLQAVVRFVPAPPATWVVFSGALAVVSMPSSDFADMYHLLQTERPVFFNAAVEDFGSFQLARLGTGPERVGQGLSDPGVGI